MEYADGIIYVIRNPYDATIADYKRQVLHSHTSSVDMSVFDKPEWKAFQMQHLKVCLCQASSTVAYFIF